MASGKPGAVQSAPALAADMATGTYECWYFNQAQLTLNFTVDGPGTYTGYDGASGTYSVDALGAVTFLSGPLQGVMPDGFVASYEVRQGIPTLSYISGRGAEAAFCQRV
ncbi:hypothetical protein BSQ44_24480 [Aquibium oceanicum]|uniref:Uncharacterized protein n=1 Tax=Aquibium oceanicum TaxID=1670800 RepID=A0A1L3SXV5_9HYPH|nr:hypothetical protein BSQ44_24480 [Aquibium oceanicum]